MKGSTQDVSKKQVENCNSHNGECKIETRTSIGIWNTTFRMINKH